MAGRLRRAVTCASIFFILSATPGLGAGFDLYDQNFDLLFRDGNVIEVGATYHAPLRKVSAARASHPITGLGVAGGLGGVFTSDLARPIGRAKFEVGSFGDCQISYQSPFGGGVSYDAGWVGRYHIISADIRTDDVSAACKVDVTRGAYVFSLIAGGRGEWMSSEATRAVAVAPGFDGLSVTKADSFGLGYDVGFAVSRPEFAFRFSAIYHSRIDHELKGTQTVATPFGPPVAFPVTWDFVTPATLDLAVETGLARTLLGHLRLRFVDYSPLGTVTVFNAATGLPIGRDVLGFADTWSISVGVTKLVNEKLALDFTVGYDPDPAGPATRGPTNTVSSYVFGALSGSYAVSERVRLNGSLRAIRFLPTSMNITDPTLGPTPATYVAETGSDYGLSGSMWVSVSF
ncbi:MAG TPA: outer membrane protein transport protein [Kaistiaceae bacterium]|nr:outer membrane protein transport protein [Kaistiaceae bacterium]